MIVNKLTLKSAGFPAPLRVIPSPPKILFHTGADLNELLQKPRVTIVGSRNVSPYGKQVTTALAYKLAEQGVVIISGLALGVDSIAHQAALEAGGLTIAVLPGPVEKIYPATHTQLAQQIIAKGGALISEYPEGMPGLKQNFIARNRLMAGLAQAVVITEAAEKSGSLHTAQFALEQGKDVVAVPGNITSPGSVGTNNLLKAGAQPVTSYKDVLNILGLAEHKTSLQAVKGRNQLEQKILDLLLQGISDGEQLLKQSEIEISLFNQTLTMLEIGGKIRSLGANHWAIY
ncbi:MAG TPA: DNA-processing protein DprA [Candidatus Saccharimonadales bacterium]|nr:DNA-processing protein DprA [Candidatus Saccharimonadales bacterium]